MKASDGGLAIVQVALTTEFAGVERYVCQAANGMSERGHSVTVVGGAPRRMRAELDPVVRYQPANRPFSGALALARRRGADVVHVHMTSAELAAWLTRPLVRAPIVATRHFARERGSSPAARVAARLASRRIALDLAISRFVADSIDGPSRLLYNGVVEQPAARLEGGTVVMLQRLDDEKAGDVGLRAFARAGLAARGWRLVVGGTGRLRPALEELTRMLGLAEHVDFAGSVEDTDALLATASIFLAPAPAEPFGLSVVEAMAHGVPVVAANGGAHPETVGEDGLLFAPGDDAAAAGQLRNLADDAPVRQRVGERLRRRQQERFTLVRHLDELEDVYRSLTSTRSAASDPRPAAGGRGQPPRTTER